MIKATIQYTDCLGDKTTVTKCLTNHFVKIIKERQGYGIRPKITILVEEESFPEILTELNRSTIYGVSLIDMRFLKEKFGFYYDSIKIKSFTLIILFILIVLIWLKLFFI